jgi:glutamate/aspartate transport system substrate-binding protein
MKLPRRLAPRRLPASRCVCWIAAACVLSGAAAHAAAPASELAAAQSAVDQMPPSATLRKIAENGTIVLGVRESSVPFSYLDRQQQPTGYSHEIALRVVDEIKKRLKLPNLAVKNVLVTSANRISFVVNNQVDLECGSTAHIAERDALVAFSNSFFQYGIRMAVVETVLPARSS